MIVDFSELKNIRKSNQVEKIIFCAGVFDLCHVGHVVFFENCKKLGDILVVMLGEDKVIKTLKGSTRPIIPLSARVKMVDSLKPVDYCFVDYISTVDDSMGFLEPVFKNLKPDIYVVGEDTLDIPRRKRVSGEYRARLEIQKRTLSSKFEPVTTSGIINKIKSLS